MTENQKLILNYCRENSQVTKKDAINLIGHNYFLNADKYVGEVLSRLVNSGLLTRIKPGVFKLGTRTKKEKISENQLNLF